VIHLLQKPPTRDVKGSNQVPEERKFNSFVQQHVKKNVSQRHRLMHLHIKNVVNVKIYQLLDLEVMKVKLVMNMLHKVPGRDAKGKNLVVEERKIDYFVSQATCKDKCFSTSPTDAPTNPPSKRPSSILSGVLSSRPSLSPSFLTSSVPSLHPSAAPSLEPSDSPSSLPSVDPSGAPSSIPSSVPSLEPSSFPSNLPSLSNAPSTSGAPMYPLQLPNQVKALHPLPFQVLRRMLCLV
jgi:hypothetical protein